MTLPTQTNIARARPTLQTYMLESIHSLVSACCVGFAGAMDYRGSGTMVSTSSGVVIATAGHVLRHREFERSSLLIPARPGTVGEGVAVKLVDYIEDYGRSDTADVGFVRLKPDLVERLGLQTRAAVVEAVLDEQPLDALLEQHQQAVGLPKDWVVDEHPSSSQSVLFVRTQVNHPCPYDHPNSIKDGLSPSDGLHIDWSGHYDSRGFPRESGDPGGMSGGGLWTCKKSQEGELWTAEKSLRLAGVLYYFDVPHCVRAAPIGLWVRLLREAGIGPTSY